MFTLSVRFQEGYRPIRPDSWFPDEEKFRETSHLPLVVSHKTVSERSVHRIPVL